VNCVWKSTYFLKVIAARLWSSIRRPLAVNYIKLMASDTPKASDKSAKVELSLVGTDEARLKDIFESYLKTAQLKCHMKNTSGAILSVPFKINSVSTGT
jgi:hypothetical protein